MWNRLSVIDWLIKWLTDKPNGKIQQTHLGALLVDLDKWHTCVHSLPESAQILGGSSKRTRLILDPFPQAANDHWLPIPVCLGASEKSTTWFTPTPPCPPSTLSSARLHMSASSDTYVAFSVCQRCCFSITCWPWMNASPISCCSCIHPSIVLTQINFGYSRRRAERGNQSWLFLKHATTLSSVESAGNL